MELMTQIGMTPFTLLHILGVAFGLGIATGMDFLLARHIFSQSKLTESHVNTVITLSHFVTVALVMLWVSGLGFLLYYEMVSPEKLENPKIWSKLSIVMVLTFNGIVIHHVVLPKLKGCIDQNLLVALPYKTLALFFATGAISFVSWYFPFFYGTLPALNFAFSFQEFSVAYVVVLMAAVMISLSILGFLYAKSVMLKPKSTLNKRQFIQQNLIPVDFRKHSAPKHLNNLHIKRV